MRRGSSRDKEGVEKKTKKKKTMYCIDQSRCFKMEFNTGFSKLNTNMGEHVLKVFGKPLFKLSWFIAGVESVCTMHFVILKIQSPSQGRSKKSKKRRS